MNHPGILGIGTANPLVRLTQEESFHAAGYQGQRIRNIFLNSDIDYRHFYLEGTRNREESSDQLNRRYLRGAMKNRLPGDSELCVKAELLKRQPRGFTFSTGPWFADRQVTMQHKESVIVLMCWSRARWRDWRFPVQDSSIR